MGIEESDEAADADRVADKVAVMRVFEDQNGKMNLSTSDIGGAMLVVSQFTLYADVRKGRRPSFIRAARPEKGSLLYERFIERLRAHGYRRGARYLWCQYAGCHRERRPGNDHPRQRGTVGAHEIESARTTSN